jgi:hypothetical protein
VIKEQLLSADQAKSSAQNELKVTKQEITRAQSNHTTELSKFKQIQDDQ